MADVFTPGTDESRPRQVAEITLLDRESPRRRGATKCAVNDCNEPWGLTGTEAKQ